jgi:hypothetical protein
MIRASNQLSPKTKVVALIVLYNFYFGQISRSNVKFGVLDGQSQLKTTRSRSTVTSLFGQFTAELDVRVATRRPASILALRADVQTRPYPFPRSRVRFSSPSPSSRAWVEPSSN